MKKKYKQRRKGLLHTSLRKGSAWAWHGPRRASPSSLYPGLDETALDVTGWVKLGPQEAPAAPVSETGRGTPAATMSYSTVTEVWAVGGAENVVSEHIADRPQGSVPK